TRDRLIEPFELRPLMRVVGLFAMPAVLIAGPQYLIGLKQALGYIYYVQFGKHAGMWTFKATMPQHVMFYLNGNGACVMLGKQRFILLAIFVVGSVYLGLTRKRARIL